MLPGTIDRQHRHAREGGPVGPSRPEPGGQLMTAHEVVNELARQVMGWRPLPNRFLCSDRSWLPRWRFDPMARTADALTLLEHADPETYTLSHHNGKFTAHVCVRGKLGAAEGDSLAKTITIALAHALGLDVEEA